MPSVKVDDTTYLFGNPHTYTKLITFPIHEDVKKTDSWNTNKSVSNKIRKMAKMEKNILSQKNNWEKHFIDGIIPEENIYFAIRSFLPKDGMYTIAIVMLKADSLLGLLH